MKKWLMAYSSNTGNTKRVAEAMFAALPEGSLLKSVKEAPSADDFDVVAVGYWVTRGGPDPLTQAFLPTIRNKEVVLFQTLGAEPDSEHATTSLARAAYLVGEECTILGTFSCRGKINPALLARRKDLPKDNPHHPSEANIARWSAAAAHPDETDLENAKAFVGAMTRKLLMREAYKQKVRENGGEQSK